MRSEIAAVMLVLVGCAGGGSAEQTVTDNVARSPDDGPPPHVLSVPQVVANIAYKDNPINLIVNGDFEDYLDPHVPSGWSVDEIYGYRGMFAPASGWVGGAVQFVRNAQGQHFLAQTVQVAPNHRYTAQMVYQVVSSDSSRGGLYVIDPGSGAVLGSDEINRPTNGWHIASVTFDSERRTQVTVKIGYPSGMNGKVVYDGVSMFVEDPALHYRYQRSYRDVIGIPDQPVHDLVPQVADYVTMLLSSSLADRRAHRDAYAAYLPYYLAGFLSANDAMADWCQHTSLALAELLAMYGVPTRQIHASSVQHEFLEYFDGKRWVAFDPYYGVRYVLAGARLGVAEVVAAGMRKVSIEVPTHQHVFFLELGYLLPLWENGAFVNGIEMQ